MRKGFRKNRGIKKPPMWTVIFYMILYKSMYKGTIPILFFINF